MLPKSVFCIFTSDRCDRWFSNAVTLACIVVLYTIAAFPYDGDVFKTVAVCACIAAFFLLIRGKTEKLVDYCVIPPCISSVSPPRNASFRLLGGLIVVAILGMLERIQPYYFFQDDAHSAAFPIILQGLRGVFEEGVFPTWNPYQYLGMPTTSLGYFSLTDPFIYVSYLLSLGLFRHESATMDISAWMYFIAGYMVCYNMLRELNIRPVLSIAGSITYVLCSFNVWFGHHNNLFIPQVLWMPALGWSLVRFIKQETSLKWMIYTAISIGLLFHGGNVQMWFYAVGLWGIGITWVSLWKGKAGLPHFVHAVCAGLLGLAIVMPLLVVQAIEVENVYRGTWGGAFNYSNFIWPRFTKEFLPEEIVYWYCGTVFMAAFFIKAAIDMAYTGKGYTKKLCADTRCFTVLALVAFIMGFGDQTPLWSWLAQYPPFSHIRGAYKFIPYIIFFTMVTGVLYVEVLARRLRYGAILAACTSLVAVSIIAQQCYMNTFQGVRWLDIPLPHLWPEQKVLQDEGFTTKGRVMAHAQAWAGHPWGGTNTNFPQTLSNHYATIYRIPSVWGWWKGDSIESIQPEVNKLHEEWDDRFNFYREYGVDWVVLSRLSTSQDYEDVTPEDVAAIKEAAVFQVIPKRNQESQERPNYLIEMYNIHNPATKPIAYVTRSQQPLPHKLMANGLDIDLSSQHITDPIVITANFLYRKWFKAYTDTERNLYVGTDDYGRITVTLTKPARMLHIRYSPPWHYGFIISGILLLAVFFLNWLCPPKKQS